MATDIGSRRREPLRTVAVGSSGAVAELALALGRQPSGPYVLCGACVPSGTVYPPDAPVPRLGSVEDVAEVCDTVDADTVVVLGDDACSSSALRRIASEVRHRDIELLVARSLTDLLGSPTARLHPVAGLPLVQVEYGTRSEPVGPWARVAEHAGPLLRPALVALPMVMLVLLVILFTTHS